MEWKKVPFEYTTEIPREVWVSNSENVWKADSRYSFKVGDLGWNFNNENGPLDNITYWMPYEAPLQPNNEKKELLLLDSGL